MDGCPVCAGRRAESVALVPSLLSARADFLSLTELTLTRCVDFSLRESSDPDMYTIMIDNECHPPPPHLLPLAPAYAYNTSSMSIRLPFSVFCYGYGYVYICGLL